MKGKGEMVTFWVEDKANRTPPMEDELKVSRCVGSKQSSPFTNKALVEAMAAKKKADATGGVEAKADG